ncbi:putative metal-binding motif-containing protein [archaeon]|nr:putative metal-binding motif-containing protein [archaeon]
MQKNTLERIVQAYNHFKGTASRCVGKYLMPLSIATLLFGFGTTLAKCSDYGIFSNKDYNGYTTIFGEGTANTEETDEETTEECPDIDLDTYLDALCGGTDCDDTDPLIYPGASEICDGLDNNCNGYVDETDLDNDGFTFCSDCNDSNSNIYPGASETCDGMDNDCDSLEDELFEETSEAYADGSIVIGNNGWYTCSNGSNCGADNIAYSSGSSHNGSMGIEMLVDNKGEESISHSNPAADIFALESYVYDDLGTGIYNWGETFYLIIKNTAENRFIRLTTSNDASLNQPECGFNNSYICGFDNYNAYCIAERTEGWHKFLMRADYNSSALSCCVDTECVDIDLATEGYSGLVFDEFVLYSSGMDVYWDDIYLYCGE